MRGMIRFSCSFRKTSFLSDDDRIEYDACRYDYESLVNRNQTNEDIERQFQYFKQRYEKCKDDVTVKLKLLEDNRVSISRLLDLFS